MIFLYWSLLCCNLEVFNDVKLFILKLLKGNRSNTDWCPSYMDAFFVTNCSVTDMLYLFEICCFVVLNVKKKLVKFRLKVFY